MPTMDQITIKMAGMAALSSIRRSNSQCHQYDYTLAGPFEATGTDLAVDFMDNKTDLDSYSADE